MIAGMAEPTGPEFAQTIANAGDSAGAIGTVRVELPRGSSVGRYMILEVLGAGGMGVVYRAYDPELDRKVALKVVQHRASTAADTDGRARMLREAQAIARLSHPNVVAIHDVGTNDQQVFIAMELVEGDTLAAWLSATDHTVAEILDVAAQAGRGLAAAHRSALVHRDFKPDNVLVGRDGRARVVDFGLVRGLDGTAGHFDVVEPQVRPTTPMLSTPLTQLGAVIGTPLYMAPEQMREETIDARTDQYAFCVTLYEALAGELPYRGDNFAAIKAKVLAGSPAPFPAARKVPAHVAAAIRRGMSVRPDDRWPSMDELLAELTRDPHAHRRRWIVGGLVAVLGIAAGATVLASRTSDEDPCAGAADRIASAWGTEQRDRLHTAFAATKAPFAEGAFGSVTRRLDQYRDAWVTSYVDSCKATNVRHEQSAELLDLRTTCLHRRRTEMAAVVEMLVAADARTVRTAHGAVASLSPVDDCNDLVALQAPIKLPTDAAVRSGIADARDELARVQATFALGRFKEALPRSEALYARAKKLGYHPLEAEVGLLYGQIQSRSGDVDGAATTFVASLAVATGSKHDEIAVRLAIGLVLAASTKTDFVRGHDWVAIASGFVERLGDPPLRRATVYFGTGYLLAAEGKYAAAVDAYEHALEIRERLVPGTQEHARSLNSLAHIYDEIGRYKEARAVGERSLALQQAELGADHPEVATVLTNLGNIASDEGDLALAIKYYERSLAIRETTVPAGDDPSLLANVINNLGTIAQDQKRYDDALALHRRALAIREAIDPESADVAMSLANIAAADRAKGDHVVALAEYRRSLALAEPRLGKDHPYVGDALYGIGDCTWQAHSLEESQTALERALAIRKLGARPIEIAEVEFALARTVWDRGQHGRANELVESARKVFASTDAGKTRLAELDDWRRTHVK